MAPVNDSISWHDAIPRKRSLCQGNVARGVTVKCYGCYAHIIVFGSTLTLPTFFFFFAFFQAPLRCYV